MQYKPEHSPGDLVYGRYKIISFISRGGFGETYKAEDKQQQGLICLLKYLKPINTSSSCLRIAQQKFCQEASTLRRLGTHSQIPELYDYFEENQRFYLVEEFIDGQNLAEELKASLFSEIQVIQVLYDTLKLLDYLYQNNVIHRDIKPANLIRRSSDKRIFFFEKAIKINPQFTEAWVNQGYVYGQRKKFAEQAHACIQANKINSNSPLVWLCIGNAQFVSKQYEDAIESFTQATANCNSQRQGEKDTCAAAWSNIGDAYLALNKPQQALHAFNQALSIKKDFQQAINAKVEAQKHL